MGKKPSAIVLTDEERQYLEAQTRIRTLQAQIVTRARILLLRAQAVSIDAIADKVGLNRCSVMLCLKKFNEGGIVGVHKYIFDIFGDTVNTAFRLESVTAPRACTVSMKTAALISGNYRLYKRPPRLLKGKGKVPCYYINYQNAEYTMEFEEIKECYERLTAAFKEDRFAECRDLISRLEPTLLEPEMAKGIAIMEKNLVK